jgi:hypothetical protein
MAGQATAHVNLTIAIFPPLAAMLIDDVRHTRSPVRTGALLGLCAVAQVFVDEEILATTAIMAVLALLFAYWTLLYALAALGGHASTQAGRTSTDSLCLQRLKFSETLSRNCQAHYLHSLRALHLDAVVVCALGSHSAGRYASFFASLLGPPRRVEDALVFVV